jgi:hypothetical protein
VPPYLPALIVFGRSVFWIRLRFLSPGFCQNQQLKGRPVRTKIQLRLFKQKAYRFGTEEARTCEAWFQLTFRPQKWNLKAHVVSAVSVHWLQCGDCDAARPRQHTTGQKLFLLTSCSNPLPLDSWQVSYESHGGSRISWFALKEFYFIPTWNTIRHAGHAKWG